MKVFKESNRWVTCGLYGGGDRQQEEPGNGPTSGDNDSGGGTDSIPNPIPKTS
jgi:hypothetical protein